MSLVEVALLVIVTMSLFGACGGDDSADDSRDHELIGTCFDDLPSGLDDLYSVREGEPCDSSSFQVYAAVRPDPGTWPGADDQRLSEDESAQYADDIRAACRAVMDQQYDGPDAQIFAYSASVRSEWDRAEGMALCLTTPPVKDVP